MKINMIVAYTKEGRVIGKGNDIPWYLPEDFKHFKETTLDGMIIMGRKTWQSLPKTFLPKRMNMVITSNYVDMLHEIDKDKGERSLQFGPAFWPSIENVLNYVKALKKHGNDSIKKYLDNIWVIGGAQLYKYCLDNNMVNSVLATEVKEEHEGDVYFPKLEGKWKSNVEKDNDDFQVVRYTKVE